jgi:hypothetical protein
MITAYATVYPRFMQLEIIRPDNNQVQFKNVDDINEAQRLVYFLTRRYILEKLRGWLKQRREALRNTGSGQKFADASKLLVLLNYYDHAALLGLCHFISLHINMFEAIAPVETSRQFGHFEKIINPILSYCRKMDENNKK